MMLSDLISQLQGILNEEGDMPVQISQGYDQWSEELKPEGVGVVTNPKLSFDEKTERYWTLGNL